MFCVVDEKTGASHFFLQDEAHDTGSPSERVLSHVWHWISSLPAEQTELTLTTSNCAIQSKSSLMIKFCQWLVDIGRFASVYLHYVLPGHAKFSSDGWIGTARTKLRRAELHTTDQVADLINELPSANVAKNADLWYL
jgi:hypothetical protein